MKRSVLAAAAMAASVVAGSAVLSAQRPNDLITPGATTKVKDADVCAANFESSVKPVSNAERREALKRYGKDASSYTGELDHLVPVSLGGSNEPDNLWPMPSNSVYGAADKKALETKLHQMVCDKQISLKDAQKAMRKDWTAAFDRYVKNTPQAAGSR
jgi:hypothetical protein